LTPFAFCALATKCQTECLIYIQFACSIY
jgi:hypothetical protein